MNKLIVGLIHVWQVALYLAIICATIFWHIVLNLFTWSPELNLEAIACPVVVIALSSLVYFNSLKVNHKFGVVLSILMCFFIFYYGWALTLEEVKQQVGLIAIHLALYGLRRLKS